MTTATKSEQEEIDKLTKRVYPSDWTDLDTKAVDTIRVLAADAVQKVGNGHPGTAMSLAPLAYTLFQRIMNHDPKNPDWVGRDRFVLSCGHSSLTLYLQLYLGGFGLELSDIEALRTFGSKTPGHPEYRHTKGVEMTTGPLGQGLSSAVGMSMASRYERGLFDPKAPEGKSVFDHFIYVIASDGDIEEGITSEASSIAGNQQLGNLIVFYDDNEISIEHETQIAMGENTAKRYESYGWHVQTVIGGENVTAIEIAIEEAKSVTDKPSLILMRSIIGYPAPTKMNTGEVHGAALGADEVAATKKFLGFDPDKSFDVDPEVLKHTRKLLERGKKKHDEWDAEFKSWASKNSENKELFDRLFSNKLPKGWADNMPKWEVGSKDIATRSASGEAINAFAATLPELWGGSADLAGSNNTTIKGAKSFGPVSISTKSWTAEPYGRVLHFGIREHAMGAILSGIVLHGPTRVFGGTFLQFSDYMRGAVRLAALMGIDPIYVWTHDSIGLGEDGPTHQPIEHLSALRAIPHLDVIRPADANETSFVWKTILEKKYPNRPAALILTRQNIPILENTDEEGVSKGAYNLVDIKDPDVLLFATGSEVSLAVDSAKELEKEGIKAKVISIPCLEWFELQDQSYKDSVFNPSVSARVSVEAGIAQCWYKYLGSDGIPISIETYGQSADYKKLYEFYGITVSNIVEAAKNSIKKTKK